MNRVSTLSVAVGVLVVMIGCKKSNPPETTDPPAPGVQPHGLSPDADGADHATDGPAGQSGHAHDEVALGTIRIGEFNVELAQGHGAVAAGKSCHLVVKLPYDDHGATVVRAWLGTEDRTMSLVGRGVFAPTHGDYDIHASAPTPLPDNAKWWVEIEKPDGTKLVGSCAPIR